MGELMAKPPSAAAYKDITKKSLHLCRAEDGKVPAESQGVDYLKFLMWSGGIRFLFCLFRVDKLIVGEWQWVHWRHCCRYIL